MGSAYGAGAGADELQTVLRNLTERAYRAQESKRLDADLQLRRQAADDNTAYRHMQQTSLDEDRAARQATALAGEGARIGNSLTPGTDVAGQPDIIKALSAAGLAPQHKDATIGSTNMSGMVSTGDVGPGIGDAPRITRIARTQNPGQAARDIFQGTEQQHQAAQTRTDKEAATAQTRQDKIAAAAQAEKDRQDNLRLTASLRPEPPGHFSLQPGTGPDGKPVMYRVNAQTGEAKIVDAGGGSLGKPGGSSLNATTENRLQSAKAVTQTGNDIVSMLKDPKVAQSLGQVMSRYNNVADFIGNAPPEWSNLAGMIESYSLANMGVHGMRSSTGADAIKQTLGQGRHTPESMIAAINGLNGFSNHLLENNQGWDKGKGGGPAAAGGGADDAAVKAAALIKKYGGG